MTKGHIVDFQEMSNASHCIFAPRANIEFGPLIEGVDVNESIEELFQAFFAFDQVSLRNNSDVFVLSFNHESVLNRPEALVQVGSRMLSALAIRDMGEVEGEKFIARAGEENWWYKFNGNRYFVICLAPCYPEDSPRHIKAPFAFFMFQPVHSFDRKAVPKGGAIPQKARERIRSAFLADGKKYDFEKAQSVREGEKIFSGLIKDQETEWWKKVIRCKVNPR